MQYLKHTVYILCHVQIQDIADENPWIVFVETTDPEKPQEKLAFFEKDSMCASNIHKHSLFIYNIAVLLLLLRRN